MKLARRSVLGLLGSGAALPAIGHASPASTGSFEYGVASGDPTCRGAILWTRVTPAENGSDAAIALRWHVAVAPGARPIESGSAEARAARDFTVKVEATTLEPGSDYVYWFELADGTRSPEGRFRTLPEAGTNDVVVAVATCQLFQNGFYNAYDHIAKRERLDAVIHLGDYIYEYANDGYGGATGKRLGRLVEPDGEIVTLADYRARHASYRADPMLQAAHARAAFICVWDDHETANNSWLGGAQNHQPETEGAWKVRKAAALQAYFEWLPIRDPEAGKPWESINRSFEFGDLMTLAMVETRLLARDKGADLFGETGGAQAVRKMLEVRARPERELLGKPQSEWLETVLAASVAQGKPWQVIGNQVVMARVNGPDLEKLFGAEKAAAMLAQLPEGVRQQVERSVLAYRAGLPFNLDSWDGYPAARERLYAAFGRAGATPIVLAGDSHAFWANQLADDSGKAVAVELGTTGITSPSPGDSIPQLALGELLAGVSPEVLFCDQKSKGYILLELTKERAVADYVAMSTIEQREYEAKTVARFAVRAGDKAVLQRT
ncbi:alkaline phosphatase [Novosphingobium sp. PC22D]|uniref:alkaline phosphatase D family protein n=1 Tax=Novosphingobium sp. PC22D TaxID=1962403 RepID=UPI000BF14311|nr:alkaline phosphatase D family protein [Novosphingobium sp. PC22D]PEQ14563.1 alkaline phosphatase [Novosphingobium sp. PC22D]